ncbi:hypothetical protein CAPTEDRAFT_195763 [Capitella teleta]|uniref:RNA-directed DNA polymerase from mobile element jockey n=1 Tax=Capitella teleta TaxID=283909 RepID=R7UHP9_CAPTE|nr:hypothetical protein CAPTEDRAFT_195763 [Capitella teleta]|eukprot:ELU05598.1 hypothetical protein CAPTEDRAFT_195763 [Capitella teleta]
MLYRTGKDPALICTAIEEDLLIAAKWADIWGKRFNASKTVAMFISRPITTPPPITFAGAALEYSHEHHHLGFILDSALSLHAHLNALTRKGATEVFLLRRLSYKVKDRDLLLKIYKMYVRLHLEYASPAWAALTATQTGLLESLQRRAMRIILALPRIHHITDADYAALNITSLRHRRNFALACFMFKLNSNRLPRKLSKYKPIPHTNPYNTRNCVLQASAHKQCITLRLDSHVPCLHTPANLRNVLGSLNHMRLDDWNIYNLDNRKFLRLKYQFLRGVANRRFDDLLEILSVTVKQYFGSCGVVRIRPIFPSADVQTLMERIHASIFSNFVRKPLARKIMPLHPYRKNMMKQNSLKRDECSQIQFIKELAHNKRNV